MERRGRSCGIAAERWRRSRGEDCQAVAAKCMSGPTMERCTPSASRWSTELMKVDHGITGRVVAAVIGGALGVGPAQGELPDGAGRGETMKLCSQGHRPEVAASPRPDRTGWAATLRKITALRAKGTGPGLGAGLDD